MIPAVERRETPQWGRRMAIAMLTLMIGAVVAGTWAYSNVLRDQLVAIDRTPQPSDLEIATVGSGRIGLSRTAETELDGTWGVVGPSGYGQAGRVLGVDGDVVEREFRILEGDFQVGERVSLDADAFPDDPMAAHGIEFREVRFTGTLGPYPAWVIDRSFDSWVIILHGAGPSERSEGLRLIPPLVEAGHSVMVITVRGDAGAPVPPTELRSFGSREWPDLEAAVRYGLSQEASDLVLVGIGSGAATVAAYLHNSDDLSTIKGVVFDSAIYDPERIADRLATERRVLPPMRAIGKLLASLRFDIDWDELDQVARANEYTVQTLVLHGAADSVSQVETAREFVDQLGELATYVEFPEGRHGQLWNADPPRYEQALLDFISSVLETEE